MPRTSEIDGDSMGVERKSAAVAVREDEGSARMADRVSGYERIANNLVISSRG